MDYRLSRRFSYGRIAFPRRASAILAAHQEVSKELNDTDGLANGEMQQARIELASGKASEAVELTEESSSGIRPPESRPPPDAKRKRDPQYALLWRETPRRHRRLPLSQTVIASEVRTVPHGSSLCW